jgi:feruloyl-CoA synthase
LRALILREPPSVDGGEITDKGYINQRAVLERRAALVDAIYHPSPHPGVIDIEPAAVLHARTQAG